LWVTTSTLLPSVEHERSVVAGVKDGALTRRLLEPSLARLPKRESLAAAVDSGATFLAVCGGYQLLGHSYEVPGAEPLPGLGLVDLRTVREPGERLIGNVLIEADLGQGT
jgi:CobQ-like glutamine amidotransferase family enzyme